MQKLNHISQNDVAVSATAAQINRQFAYQTDTKNASVGSEAPCIFVVDDDPGIREVMLDLLEEHGFRVECFANGREFLGSYRQASGGCLIVDALMPDMSGLELLGLLKSNGINLPAIMMSGNPALRLAVEAMKFGAVDFIEKPFKSELLLGTIETALALTDRLFSPSAPRNESALRVASLTPRQREVLDLVLAGHIASDLHISHRTVDNHRAAIARKTCSKSLSELIQTALCASCTGQAQRQQQLSAPGWLSKDADTDRLCIEFGELASVGDIERAHWPYCGARQFPRLSPVTVNFRGDNVKNTDDLLVV